MIRGNRHLAGDEVGATLIEFAIVVPVMMLMLMGFFDLAHQAYVRSVLQGAIQKAARDATIETSAASTATLDAAVADQVRGVAGRNASFASTRLSYANFRDIGTPEPFVDKTPLNGKYDPGECFEDVNGDGLWSADAGRDGQGGAKDAVIYRMTVSYPRLFPMSRMMGWSANQAVSAATVLRNQPYADQALYKKVC